MNAAKFTLTSMILAAAFGLTLALTAAPAEAHGDSDDCLHKTDTHPHCSGGGGGGGNVSNPDDFQAECDELFNLPAGSCVKEVGGGACLFDVNVGIANGNPVMKISLIQNCTTDTMLVLPNFLVLESPNPNFPLVAEFEGCNVVNPAPDCPSSDTNTFLDGRDFVLTAVNGPGPAFSGNAVITNSTDHGDIMDITIAIEATTAGCGGSPESAINIDPSGKPAIHDPPVHTWIRILGTTVRVTGGSPPLCNAIVMQNDLTTARVMIVHDSIVEPEAYTDVGTLFSDLRMADPGSLVNIGVGSSTIGRPSGDLGTAVEFDDVDRGLIDHNTIENEIVEMGPGEGDDVPGTGVLLQGLLTTEFTIKNNTIKGGDVGIQVGPDTDGLITKNTIVGDGDENDDSGAVGILCDGAPNADIIIRKNNKVIGYDTLIDC